MVVAPALLKVTNAPRWTRGKSLAALRTLAVAPALPPAAGPALPWEPATPVYKGQADLATGNLLLTHAVTGWSALGPAVNLLLVYNSESARTGALGPRWTHSYEARILGTNPAVLVRGDGREVAYTLSGGAYAAPSGFQETLIRAPGGAWTLTFKDGSTQGFDATGRLVALTDANGNATTLTYSGALLSQITDAAGRSLLLGYTASKLTSATDPEGRVWSLGYNASGALTTVGDPTIDGSFPTTSFAYNANGLVSSVTDRLGRSWAYAYGASGVFYTVTDPSGNAAGMVTIAPSNLDANGFSSSSSATPDQAAPTYPVNTVATAYTQDAGGNAKEYGVDAQGRITAERDGSGAQTNYAWDAANNRTGIIEPGGATTTMAYDTLGRKTQQTDPRGTTNATYDAASRLTSQTDPTGRLIQYAYDGNGQIAAVGDGAVSATYNYDVRRQLVKTTASNGIISTYGYDVAGQVTSLVHRRSDGTTLASYASTYDAASRILQTVEGPTSATTAYSYDDAGRPLTENRTGANPYASSYTYNSRGLRATALRSENGATSHSGAYAYDDAGRLTNVTDSVSASGLGGSYEWNADGTLASMPATGYRRVMAYDEERRLTNISRLQNGSTTPLYSYGYGHDGGRRWRKDFAANVWDWYPCGVACSAGDLVTLRSTNGGATWTTLKTATRGATRLSEGSSFVLPTMNTTIDVSASSGGVLEGRRLRDSMGVVRGGTAVMALPDMVCVEQDADAVYAKMAAVGLAACAGARIDDLVECAKKCAGKRGKDLTNCIAKCLGLRERDRSLDDLFCIYSPDQCREGKPIKCDSNSDTDDKQSCCDLTFFKCMSTKPPIAWGKCKNAHTACYIKAGITS